MGLFVPEVLTFILTWYTVVKAEAIFPSWWFLLRKLYVSAARDPETVTREVELRRRNKDVQESPITQHLSLIAVLNSYLAKGDAPPYADAFFSMCTAVSCFVAHTIAVIPVWWITQRRDFGVPLVLLFIAFVTVHLWTLCRIAYELRSQRTHFYAIALTLISSVGIVCLIVSADPQLRTGVTGFLDCEYLESVEDTVRRLSNDFEPYGRLGYFIFYALRLFSYAIVPLLVCAVGFLTAMSVDHHTGCAQFLNSLEDDQTLIGSFAHRKMITDLMRSKPERIMGVLFTFIAPAMYIKPLVSTPLKSYYSIDPCAFEVSRLAVVFVFAILQLRAVRAHLQLSIYSPLAAAKIRRDGPHPSSSASQVVEVDPVMENHKALMVVKGMGVRLFEHVSFSTLVIMFALVSTLTTGYNTCLDKRLSPDESPHLSVWPIPPPVMGVSVESVCMKCRREDSVSLSEMSFSNRLIDRVLCDRLVPCENKNENNNKNNIVDGRTDLPASQLCLRIDPAERSQDEMMMKRRKDTKARSKTKTLHQDDMSRPIHQLLSKVLNISPAVSTSSSESSADSPREYGHGRGRGVSGWLRGLAADVFSYWSMTSLGELSKAVLGGCLFIHTIEYSLLAITYRVHRQSFQGE